MNTRDKRASAIGIGLASLRVLPAPSGVALDQADRQHLAACYRGILAGAAYTYTLLKLTAEGLTTATLATESLRDAQLLGESLVPAVLTGETLES